MDLVNNGGESMLFKKYNYELIKINKEDVDEVNYSNGEVIKTHLRYELIFERIGEPLKIKKVYMDESEFCEDRYIKGLVVKI